MTYGSNILFIDIETVAEKQSFSLLDDRWKKLWNKKVETMKDRISAYCEKDVEALMEVYKRINN